MEFEDHGDASVDERWRRLLGGDPVQRHASLSGAIPRMMEDEPHMTPEDLVPLEFHAYGRSSLAICEAIPNGPEV